MKRSDSEIIYNFQQRIAKFERQTPSLEDFSGKQLCKIVAQELSGLYYATITPNQVEQAMESFLEEYDFPLRTLSDAEFESVKIKAHKDRRVRLEGEMELREGYKNDFHSYGHEKVSLVFIFKADLNRVDVQSTTLM